MNLGELKNEILAGKIRPAYCLTGSDEFMKNMAAERIKTVVSDFQEMNISVLSSPSPAEVTDLLSTVPFGADYRVVILEDVKDYSPYSDYLNNPSPSSVLVLREMPPDGKTKKESAGNASVLAKMTVIECEPLEGSQMLSFIAREAKNYDAEIEEGAARLLNEYCRGDMMRLRGETRKLASLRSRDIITCDDVKELVKPDTEYSVWGLADIIAAGNQKSALNMYNGLDDGRTETRTMLFGAVYSHFRKLYYSSVTASDELLIKNLNMKQFIIGKTRNQAKKIGQEKLKNALLFLSDLDFRSKNGLIPAAAYPEYLILGLINSLKEGEN